MTSPIPCTSFLLLIVCFPICTSYLIRLISHNHLIIPGPDHGNLIKYIKKRHITGAHTRGPSGDGPGSVPLHPLHCRLHLPLPSCHLQKFSDDSAIVGLITKEDYGEYRGLTQDFVDCCQRNCLQINAGKTKELVVDFRRHRHSPSIPVNIQGRDI